MQRCHTHGRARHQKYLLGAPSTNAPSRVDVSLYTEPPLPARPAVAAALARRNSRALLATDATQTAGDGSKFEMPFKSVLAANRGEIAVRIMRAGNELGLRTVGIFSKEDRFTQHRWADGRIGGRAGLPLGFDLSLPFVFLPLLELSSLPLAPILHYD